MSFHRQYYNSFNVKPGVQKARSGSYVANTGNQKDARLDSEPSPYLLKKFFHFRNCRVHSR